MSEQNFTNNFYVISMNEITENRTSEITLYVHNMDELRGVETSEVTLSVIGTVEKI